MRSAVVWVTLVLATAAFHPVHADTLLVLPFASLSRQAANLDWIGESIADDIRETIAAEGLIALERSELDEALKRLGIRHNVLLTRASVIKIAEALSAEQVVYGEFEFLPSPPTTTTTRGNLKVTGHVLDLKGLRQGPEFNELGSLEDLAGIQSRVSWRALRYVQPSGTPPLEEFQKTRPSIRLDALEFYVRGLVAPHADVKHRYFSNAIRIDPQYSRVHYQLGQLHFQKQEYKLALDALSKVNPRDAHSRKAEFLSGICRFHTGDFAGAQAAFEKVAKEVPLSEVLNNIGVAQARRNLPESIDMLRKALEDDPTDGDYQFNVGIGLWRRGQFEQAIPHFEAAGARNPDDATAKQMLVRCQKKSGPRPQDLFEIRERIKTSYEETAWLQLKSMLLPAKPDE
jgi:tetratricopeptide (TPR) repeat protein